MTGKSTLISKFFYTLTTPLPFFQILTLDHMTMSNHDDKYVRYLKPEPKSYVKEIDQT